MHYVYTKYLFVGIYNIFMTHFVRIDTRVLRTNKIYVGTRRIIYYVYNMLLLIIIFIFYVYSRAEIRDMYVIIIVRYYIILYLPLAAIYSISVEV